MDNRDILRIFYKAAGIKTIKGNPDSFLPMLPSLLMDKVDQIYHDEIMKADFGAARGERYIIREEWGRAHKVIRDKFLACFQGEARDYVIEKMDGLQEYIARDVMILKVQIHDMCFHLRTTEERELISWLYVCEVLTLAAQLSYRDVFRKDNPHIGSIYKRICKLRDMSYVSDRNLDLSESQPVADATQIICNKMLKWIKEESIYDEVAQTD